MAKARKTTKASAPKAKKKAIKRNGVPRRSLDSWAASYARLLEDPCGAPLIHPVYPGGDAGFLVRTDAVLTFGGGATETAGYVHWTPGYPNSSNSDLLAGATTSPSATVAAATNGSGPGKTFLNGNAFGARCVAACVKVSYPGSESGRSGRLHYGITQGATIDAGDLVSIDGLAPLLQHYTRTPPEAVEIIWKPNIADTEIVDPSAAASAPAKDRKSSITVAWAGIPGATGMTLHFTAVYEWQPARATGVSFNTNGKNPSSNTMDDVIDFLQSRGFNWVRNAAGAAGSAMVSGAASTLANLLGSMPARPRLMGYPSQAFR